jgi:hypothetical protein
MEMEIYRTENEPRGMSSKKNTFGVKIVESAGGQT